VAEKPFEGKWRYTMKTIQQPLDLICQLFLDLEELTDCSLARDVATVIRRADHEGLPFLTQTLPSFGDFFFRSLQAGAILHPPAFKRKGALPQFLRGLTSRVFDENTGELLKSP
jgi:hypothetical protein